MSKNITNKYPEVPEAQEDLLEISEKIKNLKFKKRLFGGVDLLDVWRKLSQIDKSYQDFMMAQKEYYEKKLLEAEKTNIELATRLAKQREISPMEEISYEK